MDGWVPCRWLIQKSNVQAKDNGSDLESCQRTLSLQLLSRTLWTAFSVKSIGLWLLLKKSTKMTEKNAASWHKKTKLGVHLADRARPKSPFFLEKGFKKRRSEKKSRSKFLKGKNADVHLHQCWRGFIQIDIPVSWDIWLVENLGSHNRQ